MRTRTSSRRLPRERETGRAARRGLLRVRPAGCAAALVRILERLPVLQGAPIHLGFRPALWAHRGRLRCGPPGTAVHAASFLRRRRILLESRLLGNWSRLARILVHELFHFVWVRLGNPARRSWERVIGCEWRRGARGELGYSSYWRKQALRARPAETGSRRWRDYLCESFCDTAAWLFGGRGSEERTLGARWRRLRSRWFRELTARGTLPV